MNDSEVLVSSERVSKKFCRSLKRSLWYGAQDVANSLIPWKRDEAGAPLYGDNALHERGLRKDEFWAVRDVSFEVRRGECLGLIGHNGAGKSTLLKILNGLNRPDSGRVTMKGRVGALIELNAGFNPILTGRENIYNQAALLGFSKKETDAKFDAIIEFSELEDFLDMPVQNYSSGMKVKLGFAVFSQIEPDILLIDEVLAVGDIAFRFKCLNAIGRLMQSSAVIFVTHSMPQVFRICNQVLVLKGGIPTYCGRDVSAGAQLYTALFDGSAQNVVGSGEASILDLTVSCGPNRAAKGESLEIDHGDPIEICARVKSVPNLQNVRIEFLLWNAEMLPVLEVTTDSLVGYPFDLPQSGEAEITARCKSITLNSGRYLLSAVVTTEDHSKVLCRHDNIVSILIKAGSPSGAHMLTVADWTYVPILTGPSSSQHLAVGSE